MSACSSSELSDSYFNTKRRLTTAKCFCAAGSFFTHNYHMLSKTQFGLLCLKQMYFNCLHLLKHSLVSLTNFSVLFAHKM